MPGGCHSRASQDGCRCKGTAQRDLFLACRKSSSCWQHAASAGRRPQGIIGAVLYACLKCQAGTHSHHKTCLDVAVWQVCLQTGKGSALGIGFYPAFKYDASSGGGAARVLALSDTKISLTFDTAHLNIPSVTWRTGKVSDVEGPKATLQQSWELSSAVVCSKVSLGTPATSVPD